jgi:hypothetical protein
LFRELPERHITDSRWRLVVADVEQRAIAKAIFARVAPATNVAGFPHGTRMAPAGFYLADRSAHGNIAGGRGSLVVTDGLRVPIA